jgi:hypothetical protein
MAEQSLPRVQPYATPVRAQQRGRLSPRWRKLLLTVHVGISVGLIGADLSVITLGITALASSNPELIRAAYLVMEILAGRVMLPLAAGALLSGILIGLATPWGLARYYWVLSKLVLTVAALTALVFVLRPRLDQAAAVALSAMPADLAAAGIGPLGVAAVIGPSGALLALLINTILAYYKPWGQVKLRRS